MVDKLPIKLTSETLVDSVFEVRFSKTIPLSSILPGIFYNKLDGKKVISQTPIATLPKNVRDNDPNLKYAPFVRVVWDKFILLIGDHNVAFGCQMPYPGWTCFKKNIIMILEVLSSVEAIQSIGRYSMKYVDLLPYIDLKDQINAINLKIQLGEYLLANEMFQFRTEINKGEYKNAVQIVAAATVTLADQKTKKQGLVIDIDTISDTNIKITDFLIGISDKLDNIHNINKCMFFSCLTPNTLKDLGPIYE
jgi:uncharacterized protein (TIGR04255 family)